MSNVTNTPEFELELRKKHTEYKEALDKAEESQAWWETTVGSDQWKELQSEMEKEMQLEREQLESAKSEDIKTLQSSIQAKKKLMQKIIALSSTTRVVSARQRLREFEDKNALLLSADNQRSKQPAAQV